ncbi:DUF3467 domain-containing protein [Anaerolineales bacterium HSG24]|nr:DUF3467 domain-containing protein [Anaerolineales bacterium HSG24]
MTQRPTGNKPTKLNIELPADLEATYANLALISHSTSEVIIDFARIMPNIPKAKVYSRIVMTPMNAKLLLRALAENLQKYEAKYGEIPVPIQPVLLDRSRGFTD